MRGLVWIGLTGCITASEPAEPPPVEGPVRAVHVAWTNDHEPPTAQNCYAHLVLEVRFRTDLVEGPLLVYPGIACVDGVFELRGLAGKYWIAEVATIESAMGVPIAEDGTATADLISWER